MHLGLLCQKARESLGLSQAEFAEFAEVSVEELAAFEEDPRTREPTTLSRITKAFRMLKAEVDRNPARQPASSGTD